MITIQDLAKECGVSIATISRAFSDTGKISPKTREQILKRARELNYAPNAIARSLQGKQTHSIGVIIPEISNSFYLSVIQKMEQLYRKNGYHFIIGFYEPEISKEADIISDMFSYRVDALIFSPYDRSSEGILRRCFASERVLQLFTNYYPEYDSLMIDDNYGTALATEHLIANGHERILYYGQESRVSGYLETMQKHGLSTDGLCFASSGLKDYAVEDCIRTAKPTAILGIARWSENVIRAVNRMGLRIPQDISVISYDDVEWTRMLDITAVAHPLDEIASLSIDLLLPGMEKKDEPHTPQHKLITPHIVSRKSVQRK